MFRELIDKIAESKKIAIFNHINPDGDALGSAYGLKLALNSIGKQAEVFLREGDETLKEFKLLCGTKRSGLSIEECDLKIAVDCADLDRIGDFKELFTGNTVAVDHHVTHKSFAQTTVVCAEAPAAGEVVFDIIKELDVPLTREIALNLYMAIACDTGNFRYSSTTAKTHRVAASLIETGIDFAELTKKLFDTKSIEYLNMYKKGIEKLEMYEDGKIAVLYFSQQDFAETGISEADADEIVNLPGVIQGVVVGVYIRQRDEAFKVSLRSSDRVDVSKIAMAFGGGGHRNASGFQVKKPIKQVKDEIISEIKKCI